MKQHVNLFGRADFSGPFWPLPIIELPLIQMAYNMADMIWLGRVGSSAVAAVGAAGDEYVAFNGDCHAFHVWAARSRLPHSLQELRIRETAVYAQSALQMGILSRIIYGILAILFNGPADRFFKLNSPQVITDAQVYPGHYLRPDWCSSMLNQMLTRNFYGSGNSQTPFWRGISRLSY